MIRKRVGWLCVLFLGEMLTASAMGFFEKEIARAVVLALFIPLIISSGGNSGSQATTLVIRAMALGEVRLRDWWRVIRREFLAGLGLGLVLAVIGFMRIVVWEGLFHTYGPHYIGIAATVALSLVGVVLWGTLAGSMLPFILRRLGLRPRQRVGAVRRHAGRRERPGHLLHGRGGDPGGDVALTVRPAARGALRARRCCCLARAAVAAGCDDEPPAAPSRPTPSRSTRARTPAARRCRRSPASSGASDGALLLDSVTPYRATGTNLYYLQQLLSYAQQDQDPQALQAVGEVLDDLVCLSLPVARIWGFNDSKDTSSIRRSPEEGFREEGLRGLDQAVWEAKRRGIRAHPPAGQQLGRVRRAARLRGLGVGDVRRHATSTTTSSRTRR